MPCTNYREDDDQHEYKYALQSEFKQVEAFLCGLTTMLEKEIKCVSIDVEGRGDNTWSFTYTGRDYLDKVDWKEVGCSKGTFLSWWKTYKKKDEERRTQEAKKRASDVRKRELHESINRKLTAEELSFLTQNKDKFK